MMKRIKIWVGILTLIITSSFITNTSHATSVDAITLESISAVSATVLTGENIVMQLEVAVPTGYDWDPNVTALGGKISLLFCPTSRYSEATGAASDNERQNCVGSTDRASRPIGPRTVQEREGRGIFGEPGPPREK